MKPTVDTCTKCGERKAPCEFYGRNHWCRACKRSYARKWQAENRESHRETKRRWIAANKDRVNEKRRARRHAVPGYAAAERARDKYGISPSQYADFMAQTAGLCAICHRPSARLHIDHDHETGKVRGLLCRGCNHGLGNFRDSISELESAIEYLRSHGKT